jgi:hypothetical protein
MRVPWVGRTGIREGDATDPLNPVVLDRGSTFGFSDVTFLGQYRFFNDKKTQTEAAVLLGVKVRVIARNLEAKRITMASWLGLPSSADAGRRASPCGAPTDC